MAQESLLPGTDALLRNTAEMMKYHGKWIVRVRDKNGMTFRRSFPMTEAGRDDGVNYLWEQAYKLQEEMSG